MLSEVQDTVKLLGHIYTTPPPDSSHQGGTLSLHKQYMLCLYLLWNRTWGPKCWTQEDRDGVKGTGFIGRQAGSQTGRGPVTGRQSDSQGLDDKRVVRQAGLRWQGEN